MRIQISILGFKGLKSAVITAGIILFFCILHELLGKKNGLNSERSWDYFFLQGSRPALHICAH